MEHIHGEERKPQPFERLLFLLGHKDTGSGSQEQAFKAAVDGSCGIQQKGPPRVGGKKDMHCGSQVIIWLTSEILFGSNAPAFVQHISELAEIRVARDTSVFVSSRMQWSRRSVVTAAGLCCGQLQRSECPKQIKCSVAHRVQDDSSQLHPKQEKTCILLFKGGDISDYECFDSKMYQML